ncbi:MAG: cation:proton antiporter [Bradyrhizobium sp.]|nr:cation:proton antiporter [Pseudomonadota bacterium]MDE2471063.1 cation:proton antiporter [Bradyrhizobium sp.]
MSNQHSYLLLTAAMWIGLGLFASILSNVTATSVALSEILVGAAIANTFGLHSAPWIDYLAGFGAIALAFLSGAEIRISAAWTRAWVTLTIGIASFAAPFVGVFLFTTIFAGWTAWQALIAAIALSTTSVALVYAIVLERGQSESQVGQTVLAARFVNDIGTIAALIIVTAAIDYRLLSLLCGTLIFALAIPAVAPWCVRSERTTSEADVRFLVLVLLLIGGLAEFSNVEAVVPAYIVGVSLSPTLQNHEATVKKLRTLAFSCLTPFYFLRAGSLVDLSQWQDIAAMSAILLTIKIATKCASIVPLTYAFKMQTSDGWSVALLMSTGLTFGTITASVGLAHGIINRRQYAALVIAVIVSGAFPAFIADRILKSRSS